MRRRLTLAIVGIATAAVVLFAVPLALVLRSSYQDEELALLQRDTIAATRTIDFGSASDPIELPESGDTIAVFDTGGRLVAGSGESSRGDLVQRVQADGRAAQSVERGQLTVAVPLLDGERIDGVVLATRSDEAVVSRTRAAWLRIAALAAAVLAAAALAAFVVGRRLAQPLERLATSARRLGDGDFAVRSQPSGVDEVDAVGSALNVTAQRLDDLIGRERAFSADASHQLRTPLSALRIELEAMELGGADAPELSAALEQVDRLQTTIDTLLNAARDSGAGTAQTDLRALLDQAAPRWRKGLGGRRLRVVVQARDPTAGASSAVVSEVLDVLVGNSNRHGEGAITITVRDGGKGVAVDVSDEGDGLSGDPERLFERRSASAGDHGIGLALARSLAHAEGGQLTVTDPGPKPVFTLLLARPQVVDEG